MINISSSFDTVSRLSNLIGNLRYLGQQQIGASIDISQIGFVTPLSITPVASIINEKCLEHNYQGDISYLNTIRFPEGINEIEKIAIRKTYLPIIHLKLEGYSREDMTRNLGSLHTKYLELLKTNIVADQRFLELITNNTFGFLLGELFDNIEEHSKAKNVYLFAQYWPKLNSCELCLIDDGVGLLGSLKKAGRDVQDSEDALRKILDTGLSAKTEFGDTKRGTGIKNTRASITNREINGEFFIMTGDIAFFHSASQGQKFFKLSNYDWRGTIVMLKLNRPASQFNLYNYVKA